MNLLISYLKLCFFKSDPLELAPTSTFSYNTVLFYLISGIIVEGLIADFADGSLEVSLRTIMAFSSVAIFLFVHKNILLFQRIFTAIFVCENFIMTLAILCEVLDFIMVKMHYEYREWVSIGMAIFLVSWYLGIVAYILRRFFAHNITTSLTYALTYFVLTYGIPMLFMDI